MTQNARSKQTRSSQTPVTLSGTPGIHSLLRTSHAAGTTQWIEFLQQGLSEVLSATALKQVCGKLCSREGNTYDIGNSVFLENVTTMMSSLHLLHLLFAKIYLSLWKPKMRLVRAK